MPDILTELARLGHVARAQTLRARGFSETALRAAVTSGVVGRPRHGWLASPLADRDQLRAIAAGARIGCHSALRRFGVWSGIDDCLHLQVPRTASRLALASAPQLIEVGNPGVWHPSLRESTRRGRDVRLASDAAPRVHWAREFAPRQALDWIVSPQSALVAALRCMDAEHASAAIDSVLHERILSRRQVDALMASLPNCSASLIDRFTGRPESGVESLFVRRMSRAGFRIESQVDLAGFGRYDGVVDGCVLFEVDGRGFHSGSDEFLADRDRTLIGQVFGVPVVRPSARHVLEDWEMTLAAVARTVEDAAIVRRHRGLPDVFG
ncbi:hypothetical protein [Agromyces albus]|uniref:DUF559 domain-containing protein n=1 Tax=Agromyces albus TaxID=205332 RepID=A0A4V1QY86_9MICO|nr:hypothetical protein [Agromyces albus]RXZ72286.1 hypothetical protein ESP51_05250 [Agromyces albus]